MTGAGLVYLPEFNKFNQSINKSVINYRIEIEIKLMNRQHKQASQQPSKTNMNKTNSHQSALINQSQLGNSNHEISGC